MQCDTCLPSPDQRARVVRRSRIAGQKIAPCPWRPSTAMRSGRSRRTCRTSPVSCTAGCRASPSQSIGNVAVERHREVADVEARDVVEEVRALAQVHVHRRQRRLDDRLRPADLRPRDRDAEPRVRAAPAAEADQQVGHAPVHQVEVEPRDLFGDGRRVPRLEPLGLHVDDVAGRRRSTPLPITRSDASSSVAGSSASRSRSTTASDTAIGRTCRKPNRAGPSSPSRGKRDRELDLDRRAERLLAARAAASRSRSLSAVLLEHEQRREGQGARAPDADAHREAIRRARRRWTRRSRSVSSSSASATAHFTRYSASATGS